jgi:hypothetical protein
MFGKSRKLFQSAAVEVFGERFPATRHPRAEAD